MKSNHAFVRNAGNGYLQTTLETTILDPIKNYVTQ